MTTNDTYNRSISYVVNGFTYLLPCLDITFYWSGSMFDRAREIVDFYQSCIGILGKSINFYRTETMTKARKIDRDSLDLIPFWLLGTETRRDIYMLYLESGAKPDEPSDHAFALNATPNEGYVRLILPTGFIEQSQEIYFDLAMKSADKSSFTSGYAGFAVNWNNLGKNKRGTLKEMYSLANRYPGLDMSHPFTTKFTASKGIKCVNWLTFVDKKYREKLNEEAGADAIIAKDVSIHNASGGGIVFQAGPTPQMGDINRQNHLPAYHQVGRILAPIRCKTHPAIFGPNGLPDPEATNLWLQRFDS